MRKQVAGLPLKVGYTTEQVFAIRQFSQAQRWRVGGLPAHARPAGTDCEMQKNAAVRAAFRLLLNYLLPGFLKYLKNSEFESITITSPCALKLAR